MQYKYMGPVSDCGAAFNSNVEILQRILQRFQNKILRIIFDASWYIINDTLHQHLNVLYV